MNRKRILFLSKTNNWCESALEFAKSFPVDLDVYAGEPGNLFPVDPETWDYDCIVSFLSPWIIPPALLSRIPGPNINFHPAPPLYPGTGCYNLALYDEVSTYGATCHHMLAIPDTGKIIKTIFFPISADDSVKTLKEKTMMHMLTLFKSIFPLVANAQELPCSQEQWMRQPYRKKDLEALRLITPDMGPDEIRRRVRATAYPGFPGAYVELHGFRFAFDPEHK